MRVGLALAAALLPSLAMAQGFEVEPSAAMRCLGPAAVVAEGPEYPIYALQRRLGGRVVVELTFTHPKRGPSVRLRETSADDLDTRQLLFEAVEQHVALLRVPCLDAEKAPARVVREYVFAPDRRELAAPSSSDPDAEASNGLGRCIKHLEEGSTPVFPGRAQREGIAGRVLAELTFSAADRPPSVRMHSRRSARVLADAVAEWARGLRMPCHKDSPVTVRWMQAFVFEGEASGFKPLTLPQWLGAVKDIRRQTVQFDTTTMKCPFDLKVRYWQPSTRNSVFEVIDPSPERRPNAEESARRGPLLEWLAGTELVLNEETLDHVYGDTANITVPCIKIDLKPKE